MEQELPIYYLTINEDKQESGMSAIALVDDPAIMTNWMAFSKQEQEFQFKTDEERRIVSGPAMIADLPIYRRTDKGKEYFVKLSPDVIEKVALKFMKEGRTKAVNEMHDADAIPSDVFIFEFFIIDSKRGITTPKGFKELPNGSLFVSMKVDNDEVWKKVKAGEYNGFSIEGMFDMVFGTEEKPKDIVSQIKEILNK